MQNLDDGRLAPLSREECLALLATRSVGRVSVTLRALPTILPVNYVLDGDAVVFRTGAGSKLYAAARHAVVAFEVDDIDEENRSGWSVVVVGAATEVTDRDERERLLALPLEPWAGAGDRPHVIRVPAIQITGRRLHPAPVVIPDDEASTSPVGGGASRPPAG